MIKAYDNFYRSNQTGFGKGTSGQIWTPGGVGTYTVTNNKGTISGTGGADSNAQYGSQILTDQDIYCRIIIGDGGDVPAVLGRFTAGPSDYKVVWFGGNIHLSKAIVGANTHMVTLAFPMALNVQYWFHLRCQGNQISGNAWLDGSLEPLQWMMQTIDNSLASGGFGLLGSSGFGPGIQYDNFVVTDSLDQMVYTLNGLVTPVATL